MESRKEVRMAHTDLSSSVSLKNAKCSKFLDIGLNLADLVQVNGKGIVLGWFWFSCTGAANLHAMLFFESLP